MGAEDYSHCSAAAGLASAVARLAAAFVFVLARISRGDGSVSAERLQRRGREEIVSCAMANQWCGMPAVQCCVQLQGARTGESDTWSRLRR